MSILRRLKAGMLLFGTAMGMIFPVFAGLFVDFHSGEVIWFTVCSILGGMAIGAVSFALVRYILLRKLFELSKGYRKIARGQLGHTIGITSQDEIGQMFEGFNEMSLALQSIIGNIKGGADDLNDVSGNLSLFATSLKNTISEQDMNISSLSEATSRVSETLISVDSKLQGTAAHSRTIAEHAESISEILNTSISAMTKTDKSMSQTVERFEELHKQSEDISGIITIIDDIADQTNLLALNAAIEAARAGEHGRGFAVVADEVRKLSEKTTRSTSQIQQYIAHLKDGVTNTVVSINEHSDQLSSFMATLNESSDNVTEIRDIIEASMDMVQTVSGDVTEQTDAVHEVNRFMQKIGEAFNGLSGTSKGLVGESTRIIGITGGFSESLETLGQNPIVPQAASDAM